jgi:colicin import membrane protein
MQIEFKSASVISAGLHAAVLLFALLTFSGATLEATPPESMPIDLVTSDDFSKLAKGAKDAPKAETPKPLVEKKAEIPKPVEEQKPKPVEKKPDVQAAKEPTPPKTEQQKPDPIAEKLKDEPKPAAEKPPEKKVELPPKKPTPPPKPQPKFDAEKIAALLDKRDVTREASAGETLNDKPSLGAAKGEAAQLSQSEIDALRARLRQCWSPPVGAANARLVVIYRVLFRKDGSLAAAPSLVQAPASEPGPVLAESARRALLQCQPYTMLKPEHYEQWKDMQITFDPRDMFGG